MIELARKSRGQQWLGEGHPLPEGCFYCKPEIWWSADKKLLYFTYADLLPKHWIGYERLLEEPKTGTFDGGIKVNDREAGTYYRQTFPFSCWSVKSLHSVTRKWDAEYIDRDDSDMAKAFADFAYLENWSNPLPPRIEYRHSGGDYFDRGYRPHYLKPGDWLIKHSDGTAEIMSDADVKAKLVVA